MTSLQTAPTPVPPLEDHEHGWCVESRHATSEGMILYVVCAGCGARRVDLQPREPSPPIALSITARARV